LWTLSLILEKKKPNIKQYAIIGIILSSVIAALSQCTGIHENNLWDLLDEIQRKYFPQTMLNDFIIKDDKKLERRIKRDVDAAISEYERLTGDTGVVRIPPPRYIEKPVNESVCYSEECKKLGGEMRLCAPWVDGCHEGC
jgi:siderophore synthetase component